MKKLSKKGKVVLAASMAVFALTCTVGVGMSKSKAAEETLSDNTNRIYNSNFAQTKVMSTEGKYNSVGKKNNDFSGTPLRVYGTADAIVTNAYVVYTRDVW